MELDVELDVIEHEPTVLEYARFHGLSCDYTQELSQCYKIASLSDEDIDLDLQHPQDDAALTKPVEELTRERLTVSKEAATLLRSVYSLREAPDDLQLISEVKRRILNLKQEVPLLQTDHELDVLEFGKALESCIHEPKIPLEPVDEENDEGLGWPSSYFSYPAQCDEEARTEKLRVSKEVLLYLQDVVKGNSSPAGLEMMIREEVTHQKNNATRLLTPPLLPSTPPLVPYIPSSPGNQLEFISDGSSSINAEGKALEQQIISADTFVQQNFERSDPMLFDSSEYDKSLQSFLSPATKRKASELKLETPLTPLMFSESPAKKLKTVAFAEMLVEYIPDPPSKYNDNFCNEGDCQNEPDADPELPSKYEDGNNVLGPEDDYAFLKDMQESAQDINCKLENEKLSEADTTKRVPVPELDFSLPTAPWDELTCNIPPDSSTTELDAQPSFLLWVKQNQLKSATTWHGLSELERILPLAPFSPEAARVFMDEKLHGEDVLAKMLADMTVGEIATSSTAMWKKVGLRILEEYEDEEETLEPADLEERDDIDLLFRTPQLRTRNGDGNHKLLGGVKPLPLSTVIESKRPRCVSVESHHWTKALCTTSGSSTRQLQQQTINSVPQTRITHDRERGTRLMFGGRFSATSALDNFMALHGIIAMPDAKARNGLLPERPPKLPPSSHLQATKQAHNDTVKVTERGTQEMKKAARTPFNMPTLPEHLPPCSFIISSTLLQRRSLSKQIENMFPDAEFVSRDFDSKHLTIKEADLVLSPSTGLVLATLQQLKQCALPGQPEHSPVKERVLALNDIYERVVVLVSEGLSLERQVGQILDHRDQNAINEYERLAAQLDGEVIIRYVPGGEQHLARSIVIAMAQFGLPHGSKDIGDIKLLPDQTTWEFFLRRTGLNAFAAQVILALLKDPITWPLHSTDHASDLTSTSIQTCGLQTFFFMSCENRVQNFQAILGGRRILKRVSALLDESWPSAAHNFQLPLQ